MTLAYPGSAARLALLISCILAWPLVVSAATVTVPGTFPTIQAAINGVADGSTINVAAGVYREALVMNNTTRSFTIRGVAGSTIVDAAGKGLPVVQVLGATGHIVFDGLTFQNGTRSAGGGFIVTNSSPAFLSKL